MFAAAGLISFLCADHNYRVIIAGWLSINEALGSASIFTADHTNGVELGYILSN